MNVYEEDLDLGIMKKILEYVFEYSKKYIFQWCIYVIVCCILGIIAMIRPIVNGKFIDYLILGQAKNKEPLFVILFVVFIHIILMILAIIFGYIGQKIYIVLQYKISYIISKNTIQHILKAPFSYIYKKILYI